MVTAANPGRPIGRCQQCIDFFTIEEFDSSPDMTFARHGQYLLALQHVLRFAHRHEAEE